MATNGTPLVERMKEAALRVSTQGVRYIVEGTVAAVKAMDRLQELVPKQERVVRVKREPARGRARAQPRADRPVEQVLQQTRATAARVLEEARATQKRIMEARPARSPMKTSAPEAMEEAPAPAKRRTPARKTQRTQGRKTTPTTSASAPRRATAAPEGFKAKRGQKHKH